MPGGRQSGCAWRDFNGPHSAATNNAAGRRRTVPLVADKGHGFRPIILASSVDGRRTRSGTTVLAVGPRDNDDNDGDRRGSELDVHSFFRPNPIQSINIWYWIELVNHVPLSMCQPNSDLVKPG